MKFSKKILATVALSASLFGGASAANAAIHNVGGGTWDQGVNYLVMNTWSNYHHPSKAHGSTACSAKGCDRATAPPNRWSKASIRATWGGNTSYCNH